MLFGTENPHGGDVYSREIYLDFSVNVNPYGTPQSVLDAITESLPFMHRYPDPHCRKLTSAIAEFECVPREYILCGNGASELIRSFCRAAFPARAAETAPSFSEYSLGLERLGCDVIRYPLSREKDFILDGNFLEFLRQRSPNAIFLCNPNNPTGRLINPKLLKDILSFCAENDIRLLLDECFLDMSDGGESLKAYLRDVPQLFILKAFTKSFGMAGLRLGYCMCSDKELLSNISADAQPWNVSLPAQAAGVAALRDSEFVQMAGEMISRERPRLKRELEKLGFYVCPSEAVFLLFQGREGLDRDLLSGGIAIRSCENFHGLGPGWYRAAVKLPEENDALIKAIADIEGR